MASLGRKGRRKTKPEMNVTPLVDVVLVLLIIFMIVIPASQGVQLETPAVSNVDEDTDDSIPPIVLSITERGTFFIDDGMVPDGQLTPLLVSAHRHNPRARLVLRGDRALGYARAREAFAAAQTVGFPGISLRVNHEETDLRQARSQEGQGD
ncbi:MAG: ExbD/TolR family protein [Sandaracinaceae bacterium]